MCHIYSDFIWALRAIVAFLVAHVAHMCSGQLHSTCVGSLCVRQPHAGPGRVGHRSSSCPVTSHRVQMVSCASGQLSLLCPFGPIASCAFALLALVLVGIRSSKRFGALSCRMRCSAFCIRARNGRLHRTCCTRYGHVPLFLADAEIARIAYGNFGSLSCRFGASQMHS